MDEEEREPAMLYRGEIYEMRAEMRDEDGETRDECNMRDEKRELCSRSEIEDNKPRHRALMTHTGTYRCGI